MVHASSSMDGSLPSPLGPNRSDADQTKVSVYEMESETKQTKQTKQDMITFGAATVIPDASPRKPTHFSEGDTVSVFWNVGKTSKWVECMVVFCVHDREVCAIYPENSLNFYFHQPHDEVYVIQDLSRIQWKWATMTSEWEYQLACRNKANISRIGKCHLLRHNVCPLTNTNVLTKE